MSALPVDPDRVSNIIQTLTQYVAVGDQIFHDGGTGTARLKPLVTSDQFKDELSDADAIVSAGRHTEGSSVVRDVVVQQTTAVEGGERSIVYACIDSSNVKYFDDSGKEVTNPDRKGSQTVQVTLVGPTSGEYLIDGIEPWTPDDC